MWTERKRRDFNKIVNRCIEKPKYDATTESHRGETTATRIHSRWRRNSTGASLEDRNPETGRHFVCLFTIVLEKGFYRTLHWKKTRILERNRLDTSNGSEGFSFFIFFGNQWHTFLILYGLENPPDRMDAAVRWLNIPRARCPRQPEISSRVSGTGDRVLVWVLHQFAGCVVQLTAYWCILGIINRFCSFFLLARMPKYKLNPVSYTWQ